MFLKVNCLKLVQSHNVPSLSPELDQLLELLPPIPRKWIKEISSNRDFTKSMPPNSKLVDPSPVPPPRHNKLKKAISSTGALPASLVRTYITIFFIQKKMVML